MMLKKVGRYILAPIFHELGHLIIAGGIKPPYLTYNPGYDIVTFVMHFIVWNDSVKIAGFLFSLILLYKYRSPLFILYLIFLARWDFISIYAEHFVHFV